MQALHKSLVDVRPFRAGLSALSISKLSVRFGARTILDSVNLDVRQGEFVCIVGSSGSGKTTLLRVLAGLARADEGKVLFEGAEISGPSRDRAIIFQDYSKALLPWRTVRGNVALEPGSAECPRRRAGRHYRRTARQDGFEPGKRSVSEPVVRRHAAARADRTVSRAGPETVADGRALRCARRDDPADSAGRDPAAGGRQAHRNRVHHTRPRRGDLSWRSRRRARWFTGRRH